VVHRTEINSPLPGESEIKSRTTVIACISISILFLVMLGVWAYAYYSWNVVEKKGVAQPHLAFQEDDAELVKDRIELNVALNRQLAILQEASFWLVVAHDSDALKSLNAEERTVRGRVNEIDRKMKLRWGDRLKTKGKIGPEKMAQYNLLAEGTKTIIAETLIACHAGMRLEHEAAKAKLRADVTRSRPLAPDKFFSPTAPGGIDAQREHDMRQAAQDNLVRAEREHEISKRWLEMYSAIANKWIRKAHEDNQKHLTTFETSFSRK
jgi:hypothetical protein